MRLPRPRLPRFPRPADPAQVVAWVALAAVVAALVTVTALGARIARGGPELTGASDPVFFDGQSAAQPAASYAVPDPAPLDARLRTPTLLVVGSDSGPRLADRIRRTRGVSAVEPIGLASLVVMGRTVNAAAVEPGSYRRLASGETARMEAVWDAVARGDVAVTHGIAEGLRLGLGGQIATGTGSSGSTVPIGAIATTVSGIDLVVNHARGAQLGIPSDNAAVVSVADSADTDAVREAVQRSLGRGASVTDLTVEPGTGVYAARLVGSSVADAVGSFGYRFFRDGTVAPDPAWVGSSIATDDVPILGQVTCHRVMLPQLRGALTDVVAAGLADAIDAGDFGGCYSPRFIGRDPSRGLSLHTWGIAVDLNVSGNQVGTVGTIDRRVVEIFDRWGFAWGGRWRVPDPMHFELAALVR